MEEKSILHQSVIKALLYYDIFNYPLKALEVYRFLPTNSVGPKDVEEMLEHLCSKQEIFRFGEFFSIENNEGNIFRRKNGNALAEKYATVAYKRAKLIANFPFVRAVFASGSFSKGYMDEKSDLDFFIITAPGRLWIARTMIVMFKRLFFFNSHKYFCCNYFIDSDHLEVEEKNLFTATELATLIPLYGHRLYIRMMNCNPWLTTFFPNYKINSTTHNVLKDTWSAKMALESILKSKFWNPVEKFFMQTTLKRWRRLYEKKYHASDFNIAFKSNDHISKNHPNHYQLKIIRCYDEKVKNYNQQHDVHLV